LSRFDAVALQEVFEYIGVGAESVLGDDDVRLEVVEFDSDRGGVGEVAEVGCKSFEGHESVEAGVVGWEDGVFG
jgi:hypothetical protein